MDWTNSDTIVSSLYVAETRERITWCASFFYKAHKELDEGVYNKELWPAKFRNAILKSFTLFFDGKKQVGKPNLDPDVIDWAQFYDHCFELTRPKPSIFEKSE